MSEPSKTSLAPAVVQSKVTLINLGTAGRRNAQSDSLGNYQFVNLPPGDYRLEVEDTRFRRFVPPAECRPPLKAALNSRLSYRTKDSDS